MMSPRIAALPMYDFPDLEATHDALWRALAERLSGAGIGELPARLTRDVDPVETWHHPRLLLGQACEYPLAKARGRRVRLVATPTYTVPGCDRARYRSAIIVRAQDKASSIADLRLRRCAVNQLDSNSGMNLLRATLAPLTGGGRFFSSIVVSGSHFNSAMMVGDGRADVAAVDCVSYAHVQRFAAALAAKLRVAAWTTSSPSLPFITSWDTDETSVHALRSALSGITAEASLAPVCGRLYLAGFDVAPDSSFAEVLRLERDAAALGYAELH